MPTEGLHVAKFAGRLYRLDRRGWSIMLQMGEQRMSDKLTKYGSMQGMLDKDETLKSHISRMGKVRKFLYPRSKQVLTGGSECGIMGVRTSEVELT